jgi:hypothetical protein
MFHVYTPSDETLATPAGWAIAGTNRYSAIRHSLIVVPEEGAVRLNGPSMFERDLPVGLELTRVTKNATVIRSTLGVQQAITTTVASKLTTEVLAKISSGTELSVTGLKQSLSSELGGKLGTELSNSLQKSLTLTETYSVELLSEEVDTVKLTVPDARTRPATRKVFGYLKYRRHWWNVFLHSSEILVFDYSRPTLWFDSRKIVQRQTVQAGRPLFRVSFYQPDSDALSYTFDSHGPEVMEPKAISVTSLEGTCPDWVFDKPIALEVLAAQAFPASREEKKASAVRKRKVPARPSVKKAAAKKAAKKAPAKKAAKKAPARKAAKKVAAKRPAKKAARGS